MGPTPSRFLLASLAKKNLGELLSYPAISSARKGNVCLQATAGLPLEVCRQVPLIHLSDGMNAIAGLSPELQIWSQRSLQGSPCHNCETLADFVAPSASIFITQKKKQKKLLEKSKQSLETNTGRRRPQGNVSVYSWTDLVYLAFSRLWR